MIPGYLDGYEPPFRGSPLTAGSEMTASDLFWPTFLYTVGGSESAPRAFGFDLADLNDFIDTFLDPHKWPVFSLPLAGASRVHLVMRNFPDDSGVDYIFDPGAGDESIPLAAMEGHFRGPALAWPELIATAQQLDSDYTSAERLLLLLPACADRDRSSAAAAIVATALTAVGALSDVDEVGDELLNSRRYWTQDCQWIAVDDALVCRGSHAYRSLNGELTSSDLHLITHALRRAASSDL